MRKIKPVVEAVVCGACAHYYQHYVLDRGGRLYPLWYGHCGLPRAKSIPPDGTCPDWKGYEDEAVSKD